MLIRLPHWGLALLAAGALWPMSAGLAQDTSEPEAPAKVPSTPAEKADALQDDIEERSVDKRNREPRPHKIHDADPWKKHPPVWSIRDVSKDHHPYAHPSAPAPGGGHFPGGPTGRFGQPYYYTATSPDTSGTGVGGLGFGPGAQPMGGFGYGGGYSYGGGGYGGIGNYPATGGYPMIDGSLGGPGNVAPGYGGGYGAGFGGAGYGAGFGPAPGTAPAMMAPGIGGPGYGYGAGFAGGYGGGYGGQPGGFGSPNFAAMPGQLPGDPYYYHFGPGFYRQQEAGHYRFPYYSYRRPWYFPGHPSYNRDTNIPW